MRQISLTDTQSSRVCQTIISFLCEGGEKNTQKINYAGVQIVQANKITNRKKKKKHKELERTDLVTLCGGTCVL